MFESVYCVMIRVCYASETEKVNVIYYINQETSNGRCVALRYEGETQTASPAIGT